MLGVSFVGDFTDESFYLIKALELPAKIISDKNWEKNCSWAIKKIKNNQPCALVIKREFYD